MQTLKKILRAAKELYQFEVNEIAIPKDSIGFLFKKHPNRGEEGFEVSFSVPQARKGINYLSLNRMYYNKKQDTLKSSKFTLPFYYISE